MELSSIYGVCLHPPVEGGYELQHNQYPKGEKLFIPSYVEGTEYYFVDYNDRDECRWVRTPSQTLTDVQNFLMFIRDSGKEVANFRVLPESYLSKLRKNTWDAEKSRWTLDTVTNRVNFFGDREESFAESFFGVPSLTKRSGESQEDWVSRLTQLQEDGDERLKYQELIF